MKFLIFLVFFVFMPYSRGYKSLDYLTFESDHKKQNQTFDATIDSSKPLSNFGEIQEENEERSAENEADDFFGINYPNEYAVPVPSSENEVFPGNFLENFLNFYQKEYNNGESLSQPPVRRQISNWRTSDELSDSNNIPLNINAYYPKAGSPYAPNEYYEDASYLGELSHKNNSHFESPADNSFHVKHPQYFQKNYYYNYYPLVSNHEHNEPKRNNEETPFIEDSNKKGRKFHRRDSCKKYLEFLRYAFNELDESYDKRSSYNEDYSEESEEGDPQKRRRVFSTRLLGPTLYIDNSGKVSQINSQGNSIQMIESISPSSIISNSKGVQQTKLTTLAPFTLDIQTETDLPTTMSDLELDITSPATPERPVLRMDEADKDTPIDTLEPQTQIPEVKNQNFSPKSFGQWTHTLDMYATKDRFSTTVSTDFRATKLETSHNIDDEKSSPYPENNFLSSNRFRSDDYYRRSDSTMEKETPDVISEKFNSSVGSGLYWYVRSSTPTPTAIPSVGSPVNHFQSNTVVTFDNSPEPGKEKDCNDKMLPCPDIVNVTYPLNGYCNRYVSCESGRAIRRTCPEGLHFNIITKSCDFPHNSFCAYTCPEPNGYYGIPGDCSGYFICKNLIPEYRMCPPKMHWDINKSACTFAEFSSCPMKCFKSNEIRPYNGDCKAYIICLNGLPYYHKCPPNAAFDRRSQLCIPESQSKCKDDPRLLTKTSNPNILCKDVQVKLGTKVWCSNFLQSENENSKK